MKFVISGISINGFKSFEKAYNRSDGQGLRFSATQRPYACEAGLFFCAGHIFQKIQAFCFAKQEARD